MTPDDFDEFLHGRDGVGMNYLAWSLQAAYHAEQLGESEWSADIVSHIQRRMDEFDGAVVLDEVDF